MRIEISDTILGTATWDLPEDLAQKFGVLPAGQQEALKRGIGNMLLDYLLFVAIALGDKENAAQEVEKIRRMQSLLELQIRKGDIVFTPAKQMARA